MQEVQECAEFQTLPEQNMRYIELFSGIGGFRSALDPLGWECVFASEIDRYAMKSYTAMFGGSELNGDITKIEADGIPDHDLLVAGFPCQSFSVAGLRKGFEDTTRGTLFFEIARIASVKRPRLMLLENVKGLLSHDKGVTFETMCQVIHSLGYAVDFAVLNSKHYGVPQNRERIYIATKRYDSPADLEQWSITDSGVVAKAKRRVAELGIMTFNFEWPTNSAVTKRLRDVLESDVDEKFYLSDEKTANLLTQLNDRGQFKGELPLPLNLVSRGAESRGDGIAYCLKTVDGGSSKQHLLEEAEIKPIMLGSRADDLEFTVIQKTHGQNTSVSYDETGTLQAARLDKLPQVILQMGRGKNEGGIHDIAPTVTASRYEMNHAVMEVRPVLTPDREEKRQNGRRFKENDEEAFTLTAIDRHGVAIGSFKSYRIRKLTPLECWRLQGFTDEQFEKARAAGVSNSQLYKQAGNAVTVTVISAIAKGLML